MSQNRTAFEYVAGTLSGEERRKFELQLAQDPQLQQEVHFWEEQFMALQDEKQCLPPMSDSWDKITSQIDQERAHRRSSQQQQQQGWRFSNLLRWYLPAFASCLLLVAVLFNVLREEAVFPNTDYVAVLADIEGEVRLTALTTGKNQILWLQWGQVEIPSDKSYQIWAQSRRDRMIRPVAVIDDIATDRIALDQAAWRLIRDAHELIVTEEEAGGSAFDEPSETIIAKGICVRFAPPG